MSPKTKILIGILVVVILATGGLWVWKEQIVKVSCSDIISVSGLEKCIGKRIVATGILECERPGIPEKAGVHYLKFEDSTELRFLEEYPNCESYDGQKVKVVGEFYHCGELDQCAGVGLRNIKSVNLIFGIPKQEITIITDKTEYEQEKTISFTVLNGLNEKILISSCPQGEGFVEIEKQDADREWEEMILVLCDAMCAGPMNLEPGQSYTYAWRDFMTCLKDLIDLKPPGTYRVKFGYLTSLPYSDENTHWIYSNEFTIKEKVDETANWQTYRNEEHGFEFKYPENWSAIESTSPQYPYLVFVTLGTQKAVQEGGLFAVAARDQTKAEYFSSLEQEEFYIINQTDTILGDKKATFYTLGRTGSSGIQREEVIAQKDGFLLEFSKGATPGYDDIFNKILSAFKFIE